LLLSTNLLHCQDNIACFANIIQCAKKKSVPKLAQETIKAEFKNRISTAQQVTLMPPLPRNRSGHSGIASAANETKCLNSLQLNQLEQSFRKWSEKSQRPGVSLSRKRILLIFLLIRYTGARLNEVLALNPFQDIDPNRQVVSFGKTGAEQGRKIREVQMPEALFNELMTTLKDTSLKSSPSQWFQVDPGHVRRKFYERAASCGFLPAHGAPDAIRKSRGAELIQNNMPLQVVQRMLGHATPNLAASYVEFSDADIQQASRFFIEKESLRKTSARNLFFGKIRAIQPGDIQSKIDMLTIAGASVTTVITNDSLIRLGLIVGSLITAEVKAPWVILKKGHDEPDCTAENRFQGTISRITEGKIMTEYAVSLEDGTEMCSVITRESGERLGLQNGEPVWVLFNCFSVVLHRD
jgi:molybdate transport system regulatory protein